MLVIIDLAPYSFIYTLWWWNWKLHVLASCSSRSHCLHYICTQDGLKRHSK